MMRPCPNCQHPVVEGQALCPNCGAAMGGAQAAVWPPPTPHVCPRCQWGLPPGAVVCARCGLRFASVQNQNKRGWMIAGTTCGITALVVGIVAVVAGVIIVAVLLGALKACSKI